MQNNNEKCDNLPIVTMEQSSDKSTVKSGHHIATIKKLFEDHFLLVFKEYYFDNIIDFTKNYNKNVDEKIFHEPPKEVKSKKNNKLKAKKKNDDDKKTVETVGYKKRCKDVLFILFSEYVEDIVKLNELLLSTKYNKSMLNIYSIIEQNKNMIEFLYNITLICDISKLDTIYDMSDIISYMFKYNKNLNDGTLLTITLNIYMKFLSIVLDPLHKSIKISHERLISSNKLVASIYLSLENNESFRNYIFSLLGKKLPEIILEEQKDKSPKKNVKETKEVKENNTDEKTLTNKPFISLFDLNKNSNQIKIGDIIIPKIINNDINTNNNNNVIKTSDNINESNILDDLIIKKKKKSLLIDSMELPESKSTEIKTTKSKSTKLKSSKKNSKKDIENDINV